MGESQWRGLSAQAACYLQIGLGRLFLTTVHIPGPPFANHFVPLCHTHLPCCQCPTASGEVTTHFTWQEEIISLRTADRSFEWWTPEQFLQQRIIWNSIGINKVAADTRPDLAHAHAHAHAHGVTPTSFSRKAPVGGSGGGGGGRWGG